MPFSRSPILRILLTATIAAGKLATAAGAFGDPGRVARVTTELDAGVGSFRAAVAQANAGEAQRIRFDRGLTVTLRSAVVYTSESPLSIDGRGSSLSGAGVSPPLDAAAREALFVSQRASRLVLEDLSLEASFGHGVAVNVPADAPPRVRIGLHDIAIRGTAGHGLLVKELNAPGVDDAMASEASLHLTLERVHVTGAGARRGAAGVGPRGPSGVRVDEQGGGDLVARVTQSQLEANQGSGLQLEEAGEGSIDIVVSRSNFDENGRARSLLRHSDGNADRRPGAGIRLQEAGGGSIVGLLVQSSLDRNMNGLVAEEHGDGDLRSRLFRVTGQSNHDRGIRLVEAQAGTVHFETTATEISESGLDAGVEILEADDGDAEVEIMTSVLTDNSGAGLRIRQTGGGRGRLRMVESDLSQNAGGATDTRFARVTQSRTGVTQ